MEMTKVPSPAPPEILKRPYERVLIPEEDGGFSAYIAEFEGCFAQGETADEALAALNNTAIAWIEAELEAGHSIPEPWNAQEFSGRLLLRLPKSLHQQLGRLANKEGVSLNQYLVSRLSSTMRDDVLMAALEERVIVGHRTQVVTAMQLLPPNGFAFPRVSNIQITRTAIADKMSIGPYDRMTLTGIDMEGTAHVRN